MLFNIMKFFRILLKFLDDHVADPAYLLVLVTGLIMAWWHWSYTIHWIQAAIILYVIMLLFGLAIYSPALTRQIETLARRSSIRGASSILFLMVTKPGL